MTVYALSSDKSKSDFLRQIYPHAYFADLDPIIGYLRPQFRNDALVADRDLTSDELAKLAAFPLKRILVVKNQKDVDDFWLDIFTRYEQNRYGPGTFADKVDALPWAFGEQDFLRYHRELWLKQPTHHRHPKRLTSLGAFAV